jgi:hypothetical protein
MQAGEVPDHDEDGGAVNYLLFICSDDNTTPEGSTVIRRDTPGWAQEMDDRGVRLLGRALESPDTAATVRVRDGETLVTDGPFAETTELMAGFDVIDCADLDEAIEVAAKHPMSWFHAIEVRPFAGEVRLGEEAAAFAREDDSAGAPYALMTWTGATDRAVDGEPVTAAGGVHVVGGALQGPETATTVRVRDGETQLDDGPFTGTEESIAGIDVVRCADRQEAIALAAAHPHARDHAIEVRAFWSP